MSELNRSILIKNITDLMEHNHITQSKLAEILGMSQPNVNHALNPKEKKCFTLEQVIGIADYFNTSVDVLVGRTQSVNIEVSSRAIGEFIAKLLETHCGLLTPVNIEEDRFIVDDFDPYAGASHTRQSGKYLCLYLPNYWPLSSNDPEDETYNEYSQVGNSTRMFEVNQFLKQFKEIFTIYENGGLSKETYNTVLNDLLSHL